MAGRRRVHPVDFSHEDPPPELLHCSARAASSPQWTAEVFAGFLRTRAAWRDTHAEPLPWLWGRERLALLDLDLPPALVGPELAALGLSHRSEPEESSQMVHHVIRNQIKEQL